MARLLVEKGAAVNQRQEQGFTALHEAAQAGSVPLVELLLAHGADLEARTDDGRSAHDIAAQGKHQAVAERLRVRSVPK